MPDPGDGAPRAHTAGAAAATHMAGAAAATRVAAGRGTTAYGREAGRMSTRSLVQMPVWRLAADFGG